ncbi:MAG: hypothetical protein K2I81_03440 [Alphaproteobacteria bacterium]|nr:hypothetical protein [Alphaproteobacteria bacterium]
MPTSPYDFIRRNRDMQFATDAGTKMHERLRKITIDTDTTCGDSALVENIRANKNLIEYFSPAGRTEVPVAGTINGKFISRRIDRMIIDPDAKVVKILDYKTDTDRNIHRGKYKAQLREYRELLREIYPDFSIVTAILWTHDWTLEYV